MSRLLLHRIIEGDSVAGIAALPDGCVDLMFADPPCHLQLKGGLHRPNNSLVDVVDDHWDRFDCFRSPPRSTPSHASLGRLVERRPLEPGEVLVSFNGHQTARRRTNGSMSSARTARSDGVPLCLL